MKDIVRFKWFFHTHTRRILRGLTGGLRQGNKVRRKQNPINGCFNIDVFLRGDIKSIAYLSGNFKVSAARKKSAKRRKRSMEIA